MSQQPPVFSHPDIEAAVLEGALSREAADGFSAFLARRQPASISAPRPRFDLTHLLWYAGALIVMAAMGLFSTLAFAQMGGMGLAPALDTSSPLASRAITSGKSPKRSRRAAC